MAVNTNTPPREPLTKARVLETAIALADAGGSDALSMRRIAQALGVVPMALYKHVANKDELLDAMVDVVVSDIDPPGAGADWQITMRQRILSARAMLQRHPWASRVIEARTKARAQQTPVIMDYLESMIGIFREGGFSIELTHHAMHVMGSRLLGFSQELFEDNTDADPEHAPDVTPTDEMVKRYPHIAEMVMAATHDQHTTVGPGCDDQAEFEFALDLILGGLERLRTATTD